MAQVEPGSGSGLGVHDAVVIAHVEQVALYKIVFLILVFKVIIIFLLAIFYVSNKIVDVNPLM